MFQIMKIGYMIRDITHIFNNPNLFMDHPNFLDYNQSSKTQSTSITQDDYNDSCHYTHHNKCDKYHHLECQLALFEQIPLFLSAAM